MVFSFHAKSGVESSQRIDLEDVENTQRDSFFRLFSAVKYPVLYFHLEILGIINPGIHLF